MDELLNWSGWRPEDKQWIDAILSCSRCIADTVIRDHVINTIEKVKNERIRVARKGKSEGYGGLVGYE